MGKLNLHPLMQIVHGNLNCFYEPNPIKKTYKIHPGRISPGVYFSDVNPHERIFVTITTKPYDHTRPSSHLAVGGFGPR